MSIGAKIPQQVSRTHVISTKIYIDHQEGLGLRRVFEKILKDGNLDLLGEQI